MKVDVAGDCSVLVAVSAAELAAFALTYETLDYENVKTQALVSVLLREIDRKTGRQLAGGELEIDALPDPDGGCLLMFTQKPKSEETEAVFFAADITPCIDAARAAKKLPAPGRSDLFQTASGLFLLLTGCSAALQRLLSEFLVLLPQSRLQAARLEEQGRCLIAGRALEILRGA